MLRISPTPLLVLALDHRFAYGKSIAEGACQYVQDMNLPWSIEYPNVSEMDDVDQFIKSSGTLVQGIIAHIAELDQLHQIRSLGYPVINVSGRLPMEVFPQIITDDFQTGQMAAEYFLKKGFVHFAYLGIPAHLYSELRWQGFAKRIAEEGLLSTKISLNETLKSEPRHPNPVVESVFDALKNTPKPLALFCANDIRAFRAIQACQHFGIRVPEEVAVLGVDNEVSGARTSQPSLSSIELGTRQMGFLAAQMLHRHTQPGPLPLQQIKVAPVEVIERESTDTMQQENPDLRKVLRIIQNRFTEQLRVEDLPAACGLSRRTIERLFKIHLRSTPHAEIVRNRLNLARHKLLTTNDKMEKIAIESGFSSTAELYKAIRRSTGLSPTEFRRNNSPLSSPRIYSPV